MNTIPETLQKIKSFLLKIREKISSYKPYFKLKEDLFITLLIILVGVSSYGLGKLSVFETEKTPIEIDSATEKSIQTGAMESLATGTILASKTGTRYYYPSCSGASRIKDGNKIWFATEADAQAAGLTLASGCTK